MTHCDELWSIIQRRLERQRWTHLRELYHAVEHALKLDQEDWLPDAPRSSAPKWRRNVGNVLQQRKERGDVEWRQPAQYRRAGTGLTSHVV